MKRFILLPILLFATSCFWDQGNSGGGGGVREPGSSNIESFIVNIEPTKIDNESTGSFTISNFYDEEADIHVKLATDDGITDGAIFQIISSCGGGGANSFVLQKGESCDYFYFFTPKKSKFYTGIVSVDIIGKSYYETGIIANKRRLDMYLVGAGVTDPADKEDIPPSDYYVEFNGVHGYYAGNNSEGAYEFSRPHITLEFKNITDKGTTYTFEGYDEASTEFKLKFVDDKVDCKIVDNKFSLVKDAACNLNFEYVPHSKLERGQLYIAHDTGVTQRLFFLGQAYPFKAMKDGDSMDWGKVGVNFTLADTLLDLKEKIAYGEELTENFENTFDALITLKGNEDNETRYKLDFDQTKDFVIDHRLTDCSLNIDNTIITMAKGVKSCNLIVAFLPKEVGEYTSSMTILDELTEAVVSTYHFKGEGVKMRRPQLVPYAMMSSDGNSITRQPVGTKLYYALDLNGNTSYSVEGDSEAFIFEELYPSCQVTATEFKLLPGASKCRVYVAFTQLAQQDYNWKLTVNGLEYKFKATVQ